MDLVERSIPARSVRTGDWLAATGKLVVAVEPVGGDWRYRHPRGYTEASHESMVRVQRWVRSIDLRAAQTAWSSGKAG